MEQNTSVRFTSSLMNLLTFFDTSGKGRFIYLSSDEVYGGDWPEDIREEEMVKPETIKGAALAQGENICSYMGDLSKKDIVTLRLQHLYGMPESAGDCNETITWFCLETLRGKILRAAERSDTRTERYAKEFKTGEPVILRSAPGVRRVLSNERFVEEFRAVFFGSTKKMSTKSREK